jgi:aspartyl/asparaginyl beta-hydroxylase (cupin superfamily)
MAVRARHEKALAEYVDGALATVFDAHAGEDLERFRLSLDIMLGRKQRFTSMPKQYFYPGLPPVEFFDRAQFPWLDAFEAGTDPVREEFLAVLAAEQGFTPYINYAADQPLNQWIQLNNSPDWSAYHLVKDGQVVGDHAARCPKTMALWSSAPAPEQPGRTPAAMFSLLSPRTRIPAHVGSSNMRLVVHLPLIVPAGCRFRVGNTIREWVPGQAWVFDDTIEHEAWNDSDALRVVLLFDIWHPALSTAERKMITALNTCINGFGTSRAGDFPL